MDVKRNSLDDGPGIRSVVFFKGCPLRCVWCQNPETMDPRPELQREPERCSECGACQSACPHGVARPATQPQSRERCLACGACVEPCPVAGRRIAGEVRSLDALVELLSRDAPFYRRSHGGITLSGGEPTVFTRYAGELAERLHAQQIHVLVETCGLFSWTAFRDRLLPHVDSIYFDVKLADPAAHRRHTGRDNGRILANLRQLVEAGFADLLPRIPLIPGITDTEENLAAIAAVLRGLGLPRVALLPYNPLWLSKRTALGLSLPYAHREWLPAERVAQCVELLQRTGLEVIR